MKYGIIALSMITVVGCSSVGDTYKVEDTMGCYAEESGRNRGFVDQVVYTSRGVYFGTSPKSILHKYRFRADEVDFSISCETEKLMRKVEEGLVASGKETKSAKIKGRWLVQPK